MERDVQKLARNFIRAAMGRYPTERIHELWGKLVRFTEQLPRPDPDLWAEIAQRFGDSFIIFAFLRKELGGEFLVNLLIEIDKAIEEIASPQSPQSDDLSSLNN